MILLIDNYDSFSYNLYHLIGAQRPDLKVVRNDAYIVKEVEAMNPDAIFLSPGPGRPDKAGICEDVVRDLGGKVPIFGVCLGHQAICEALGGTVIYAKKLFHGKVSTIHTKEDSHLFKGLGDFTAARYHSLAVDEATLPSGLRVTAATADGEVMAVEHRDYPLCGVQFHPESVMTATGKDIISNFLQYI